MTDRPLDHPSPQPSDGPTRDIRLPPLPPPPPTYHALEDEPTDQLHPPGAPPRDSTLAFDSPSPAVGYGQPPFGSPGTAGPAPVLPPSAPTPPPPAPRPKVHERKWPWVLLVVLPLVVIAATGVVLALLLGA
jgi:hypothetical protein